MIQEIAGGVVSSDIVDIYPKKVEDHQVFLHFAEAYKLIGEEIPRETIKSILTSLDIKINNVTESGIGMTIPAYRNDVTREVDVIEEVLRVYGYNNIAFKDKLNASISGSGRYEDHKLQNIVGDQLAALGLNEILNNSLTSPAYAALTDTLKAEHNVTMLNPLSQDLSVMRQSMLFSGLEAVVYNLNRRQESLKLFEFGKTYHQFGENREEFKHLSILLTGNQNDESWTSPTQPVSFFYLRGIVDAVLGQLGLKNLTLKPVGDSLFAEGISLSLRKKPLVKLGLISKKILKHFDIDHEVLYADFDWDAILENVGKQQILFQAIPKYPSVRRDFALLVDEEVTFDALYKIAHNVEKKALQSVNLFDVYQGKNIPKGKKSYAVSFTLLDENKTLTDKQIDKIMAKLQAAFEKELGAELR